MFTGLIEHLGTVAAIERSGGGCTLTISDAGPILGDCHVGDSIAVNGACLTVTRFDAQQNGGWFEVWLANETLERTDLAESRDQLNLERAMGPHVRFGGHFVQGHVDDTATLISRTPDEKITLGRKGVGSKVNIEVDMVGKYVEKSVSATLNEWRGLIEKVVEEVLAKRGM
ncbi:hypothetical protein BJV78DRAFT_1162436 [Lactifluus subvellereus]|nr:hypothetical protein BJV78DRAFT_1162436 [Lactifluus subvellereus]